MNYLDYSNRESQNTCICHIWFKSQLFSGASSYLQWNKHVVKSFNSGIPGLWDLMPDDLKDGADVTLIEVKCTISAMCLNHSETTPLP